MDAYDRALRLLSMREHTEMEIRAKLNGKGYNKSEIDEAISKLIDEGSLSEKRFAESYIRSRMRKNPEGKAILRLRLREKGCPVGIADEALSEFWDSDECMRFLSVYLGTLMRKKGEEGARMTLLRKGFKESEITEAFSFLDGDISE